VHEVLPQFFYDSDLWFLLGWGRCNTYEGAPYCQLFPNHKMGIF
jgi:hypothetical protein